MKTLNLSKFLPIAVAVLGIGGAFATTSMQSVSKEIPENGFTRTSNNKCTDVQVECDDFPVPEMCRISYAPAGAIAYKKVGNNDCLQPLYRPN
ncbi:DUF6520 family protein [Flavobacterium defluvii]|uniref:NVEALA protein n=1 Tax=Flavobacterium defluvii TaxID=370979 RepID=A0A1M5JCF6_9FLAO|nr:DUF6520 family protein [Flavobacterium defluvii]SHG38242.1 hypothetical protein SAMN05443663_102675 [Flavobacterium defluvii]